MFENLGKWGYAERYFWQNLLNKYLDKEKLGLYFSGISDHQMMRGVINLMKGHHSNKPPLLGVSTIETHVGFKLSKDGIIYSEGNNDVLNMIHNLDHAFGLFWNYIKESEYKNNIVIILTGDHTSYQSRDYLKVTGKNWKPSVYDEMAMIIYDPGHKLPKTLQINTTSVDLAPTVLQLANINPQKDNAFLGRSLFDSRSFDAAFGISPYPDYPVYLRMGKRTVNKTPDKIKNETDKKTLSSLHRILKYYEYLRKRGRLLTALSDQQTSLQGMH